MAFTVSKYPFETAQPAPRSRLNEALKDVANWSERDRRFFVAAFTTRKTGPQIANEMGLSLTAYLEQRRLMLRRFMRAAQSPA